VTLFIWLTLNIGYQDSGADIAYVLSENRNASVITPVVPPDPARDGDYCFPDHEEGILSAVKQGTTHLWANTILFATHPLQTSKALDPYEDAIRVVGQPPKLVDAYDDKAVVYNIMKNAGNFTLPQSLTICSSEDILQTTAARGLKYPFITKPVRGRGSHGVKLCRNESELLQHSVELYKQSSNIIIEEYLSGEEATVTIMPPSESRPEYWALPVVTRFNHIDGIAPYNGTVAVTANSRPISSAEAALDATYQQVAEECARLALLLKVTAPIRIDVRRFEKGGGPFALFDVNMKPNMTGPGRPGREDQASLTALAAGELGWGYGRLLQEILASAASLKKLRNVEI
jgi:D-alanine-D-alanine ligase-like ATP-grasp enzyme